MCGVDCEWVSPLRYTVCELCCSFECFAILILPCRTGFSCWYENCSYVSQNGLIMSIRSTDTRCPIRQVVCMVETRRVLGIICLAGYDSVRHSDSTSTAEKVTSNF